VPNDEVEIEDEADEANPLGWLVLVYRIPSEPSRLRATVWRRLKALGAVYLQNSVAALPESPAAGRALRKLRHDILQMSGTAVLMSSTVLAGEANVLATFQDARRDEYEEIVDRCQGFLAEVEKEYTKSHFTYAELEENEVDYTKLVNWFDKVRARDTFDAPGRVEAESALKKCEQVLEEYAARVYAEEPEGH
jgi:DNA-binding transcriptional regulator PaaX